MDQRRPAHIEEWGSIVGSNVVQMLHSSSTVQLENVLQNGVCF